MIVVREGRREQFNQHFPRTYYTVIPARVERERINGPLFFLFVRKLRHQSASTSHLVSLLPHRQFYNLALQNEIHVD